MQVLSISKDKIISFKEKSLTEIRSVRPRVYYLLRTMADLRESDKKLIWEYWKIYDGIGWEDADRIWTISFNEFMVATNPETIRRAAAKMRELFPGLRGSKSVQHGRKEKMISYSKKI